MAEENGNSIIKNLKRGKLIIAIANAVSAVIFFILYYFTKIEIVLYVAILLIILAIGVIWYFSKIERKYINLDRNE